MPDDEIRLRQPAEDELRAWLRPILTAFAETLRDPEFEHGRPVWETDRLIGAVDGEAWVGGGGAYSFRLTVQGGEVGAAGITMIGVTPSHRRRGILRTVMRWLLDQARERGEPLAILWASEGAIYPHFGFGMACLQATFDIQRHRVRFARPAEPLGRIRLVDPEEAVRLMAPVYDEVRARTPGAVDRTEARWGVELLGDPEWTRGAHGPKFLAVLEVDGVARGYAIYRVKGNWDENTALALEVIGVDAAAERAVWDWLLGIDLVGHIRSWRAPFPHPLMLQLAEPRQLNLVVQDGLWLRLIDMPAALEARSYEGAGSVTFELTDEFCPWNAGRWRLEVSEASGGEPGARGVASVSRFDGHPELTFDTTDLAATYLGAFTFADLARAGRVAETRPGAIAAADRLFDTAVAPWCSTPF
jgi:predicted acetyltransferase